MPTHQTTNQLAKRVVVHGVVWLAAADDESAERGDSAPGDMTFKNGERGANKPES